MFLLWLFLTIADPAGPPGTTFLFANRPSDFDRWVGDDSRWSFEDGQIVGRNTAEEPLNAHTYLIFAGDGGSPPEFDDFELTVRFKIEGEGGNSGVQYRSRRTEADGFKVAGYQADIDFDNRYAGIVYEQDGRGIVADRGMTVTRVPGEVDEKRFADDGFIRPTIHPGMWNDYRIVADGERIEHFINGQLTARLIDRVEPDGPNVARRRGIVALQLHRGPPMTVRFKDVVIRRLR